MNDTTVQTQEGFSIGCQKVLQVARELFQSKPDWVTFFRETLGVSGAARSVFPRQQDYVGFEKSREYAEIQNMVLALRNRKIPGSSGNEPTRVITVRLPESLHEALKAEANDHNTSMNKLCISKLLQVLVDNAAGKGNQQNQRTAPPMRQQIPQQVTPGNNQPLPNQGTASQTLPQQTPPPSFRSTYTPPTHRQLPPQQQLPPQTQQPPQQSLPPQQTQPPQQPPFQQQPPRNFGQ